jgi:putative FmdB family regulatory protein
MPIYEYRCENGHTFEVMQRMTDEPITTCPDHSGSAVQRVFHPVAVHFKGSGFYNTDYGKKRGGSASDTAGAKGDSSSSDSSGSKTEGSKSESSSSASKSD